MYQLKIISSSVRPGRRGPIVANWITGLAQLQEQFQTELLDLGEVNLPMMNEPNHPSLKKYQFDHTKQWSDKIEAADAFIFVTAEYDHNYPAPLRNALEYLFHEWAYKPAAIVSYGGVSGGTRAMKGLLSDLTSKSVMPISAAVNFPFFESNITDQNVFMANDVSLKAAAIMFKELLRWTIGMKTVRDEINNYAHA